MDAKDYLGVWPESISKLELALQQYEQSRLTLADFKKKYASVKQKAKRLEKDLSNTDDEIFQFVAYSIQNRVRLAENKFILIDKKLARL